MDYIKLNGNCLIPYPNSFTMTKEANIVSEIKTCTGKCLADISGWKYEDTTLSWDTLFESDLQALLLETNPVNGIFTLTFNDTESGTMTINAFRRKRVTTKTRHKKNGNVIWKDVQLEISFPDVYET